VSLLWRDQVRVLLCPDRLVVVRLARGLRRRVVAKQIFPCPGAGPDWQPALSALAEVLKQAPWQNADATVILSGWFASYLLLPPSDAILDDQERQALARHVCTRTYGEAAASLELRLSEGSLRGGTVVSCVEKELLRDLRSVFAASSLKLASVQPALMGAFNAWRRKRDSGAQWLALVESGTLCLALLHQGDWKTLRVKRLAGDWAQELPMLLRRERLSNAIAQEAKTVSVCLAEGPEAALPAADEWTFRHLQLRSVPGFTPPTDGHYGMALAGAL
jgi:hypothetical protein